MLQMSDDIKLWVIEEYRIAVERLIRLEEKHEGSLIALKMQADVYEDRLQKLNGAHEKAEADRIQFVLVTVNELYKEKIDKELEYIRKELAEYRGAKESKTRLSRMIFSIAGIVLAFITIGVAIYLSK